MLRFLTPIGAAASPKKPRLSPGLVSAASTPASDDAGEAAAADAVNPPPVVPASVASQQELIDLDSVHPSWRPLIAKEMTKPYFEALSRFVASERRSKAVFPSASQTFRVFTETPLDRLKVVVLGQDPYHGPGQAHGLAFSVPSDVQCPPSLKNIFKEIQSDLGGPLRKRADLSDWAKQGVLLLNTTLTVVSGQPNSHAGRGWDTFTDAVIKHVAKEREGVVFLLWGSHAHAKAEFINPGRHLVVKTSHPSPLGAAKTSSPFLGSKQFSRANAYLEARGGGIAWC